jgi:hypothetical protein
MTFDAERMVRWRKAGYEVGRHDDDTKVPKGFDPEH